MATKAIMCIGCQQLKPEEHYRRNTTDGERYLNCLDCWRIASKEFWSTKNFRVCKNCDEKLPLRIFKLDIYGIPYAICMPCFEKHVAENYRKTRAAAKKMVSENGASSLQDTSIGRTVPSKVTK